MGSGNILFRPEGAAITPNEIQEKIAAFTYKKATQEIVEKSKELDKDGEVKAWVSGLHS